MAKGDKSRSLNRIDEQQKTAQGYLTGVQQGLGNQYGNLSNLYFGGNAPQYGNTFGYGTTVPYYSWTGKPTGEQNKFGNQTPTYQTGQPGTAVPRWGNQIAGGQPYNPAYTSEMVQGKLMPYLKGLGAASPQALASGMSGIQGMFPGAYQEDSDEIVIPGYGRVDVGQGFEGSGPQNWQFLSQADNLARGGGQQANYPYGGIIGQTLGDYGNIFNRYQQFANTGGLSPEELSFIRARSMSPIRSAYSNAESELGRQRSLQGGYSPGMGTALSRMAREQGQLGSDQAINTEAMIAELTRQGKLAGMGGMASMYGATPGLANMFGNQALSAMGQQLQGAGLQNNLSLGMIGAQNQASQIPGNWMQAMNNIAGLGDAAWSLAGGASPWMDMLGGRGGLKPTWTPPSTMPTQPAIPSNPVYPW